MLTPATTASPPEPSHATTALSNTRSPQVRSSDYLAIYRTPGQKNLTVRRQPLEALSSESIVIMMLAAGVCGTDLAMLSGGRVCEAEILGHEGVGVVVQAPADGGMAPGTRVIINPVHRNHPEVVIGHSRNGVFSEFFSLELCESDQGNLLVSCPPECGGVSDAELVLTEPLASVLYSLELLHSRCGDCALVVRGSGTIGILAVKLWAMLTKKPAILVSQSQAHANWLMDAVSWPSQVRICSVENLVQTIAQCCGYTNVRCALLCCSRESAPAGLRVLLDCLPQHSFIDLMAGFPAGFKEPRLEDLALDRVRWDNICGANFAEPTPAVDLVTNKSFYLTGHRGTEVRHILAATGLLTQKVISLADIPHRIFTIEQLPAALEQMLSPNRIHLKWIKAIVTFSPVHHGQPAIQS
jgi:2-epi-valiolone-7-phosphate 1-reductase